MKRLASAFVTILAVAAAKDVAFAHGGAGGFHGGGHASGGTGGFHGGGGYAGGKPAVGHSAEPQSGSHTNRWHGSGWHGYGGWFGLGFGIYLGGQAYPGVWPYAYYGAYPSYDPRPMYASDTTTVYVEPEQQVAPTYYWYYCADPTGYYPYVQSCNDAWLAVVPQR